MNSDLRLMDFNPLWWEGQKIFVQKTDDKLDKLKGEEYIFLGMEQCCVDVAKGDDGWMPMP